MTKAEISRRKEYFTVEEVRTFRAVDLSDGMVAEHGFKTRAAAKEWVHEYVTRTGRFAPRDEYRRVADQVKRLFGSRGY